VIRSYNSHVSRLHQKSLAHLGATIATRVDLTPRRFGHALLELLRDSFPNHRLSRFGDAEPLRGTIVDGRTDAALKKWGGQSFTVRSRRPALLFDIFFRGSRAKLHSQLSILEFEALSDEDIRRMEKFVSQAAILTNADYGVAHILTESELQEYLQWCRITPGMNPDVVERRVKREGMPRVTFDLTVTKHSSVGLKRCLWEMLWFTVYGKPYVEMFGRANLLSAPADRVVSLSEDIISLRLTENLRSTPESWSAYKTVRERCKAYLGLNAFCEWRGTSRVPVEGGARVPEFDFRA
jgi:hypothetical protein